MASEPLIVEAVYSFKGNNNDELCFKKGDFITITQQEDGGWWEGTFNGQTGWFPSNYVVESKEVPKTLVVPQQSQYKGVVLKDLIDSEKAHVTELEGLVANFLHPLEKSTILSPDEYKQLTGNIEEVLEGHQRLLSLIEGESMKPPGDQRVGKLFLDWAPKITAIHQFYCSLHPRAVLILDKFKDELTKYMESKGAASPGVLVLTTMLSKPFRRLEKYSGMLKELERHVEESHVDRGDTQRSVFVYNEIATKCSGIRRQKELELQVVTGQIRGWEGPGLTSLGEIIYMGSVAVGPQHHDRYFVLFPTTLLILSVSQRLSGFIYEGKLSLPPLTVSRLEDSPQYKNAFEINGPMIDKRIAVCQSKEEADHWVELFKTRQPRTSTASLNQKAPTQVQYIPQPPPHMSPQQAATTPPPPSNQQRGRAGVVSATSPPPPPHAPPGWSATALRPAPPLRPTLALGSVAGQQQSDAPYARYGGKPSDTAEDGLIFDVIETYYALAKPRNTVNSVNLSNGPPPKVDAHKSISDLSLLVEKLQFLDTKVEHMTRQLNEQCRASSALQMVVKKYLKVSSKDFDDAEWQHVKMILANNNNA